MRRLYLNEISKQGLLGSNKIQFVKNWLLKHDIEIFHDGYKSFVNEIDFEIIYESPMTNSIKRRFQNNWNEVYQNYLNKDKMAIVANSHINGRMNVNNIILN